MTGGTVRVENGHPSLAVDGQCRYFMSAGWQGAGSERQSRDEGWRQGTVDDELRRLLERMVGWQDLDQPYDCEPYSSVADAPSLVIANHRSELVCPGALDQRLTLLLGAIRERAPQLWAQGRALDQDLHVVAVQDYVADGEPLPRYAWPEGLALRDFVLRDDALSAPGQSKRVAAAQAGPLREIREQFLLANRSRSSGILGGMQMSDGEISAAVYLRDALPYEDERGLWPRLPRE